MSRDPILETLAARPTPRLSPYFASRLLRHLPEPRRDAPTRNIVLGRAALLAVVFLLGLVDWPQWLSASAILLAPLAAMTLLAPRRIASGIAAAILILLREDRLN